MDQTGTISAPALADRLAGATAKYGRGRVMVAVQTANNETGVLQPIDAILAASAEHGAILVCDAVQSVGRGPPLPKADVCFLSAHKLGGPKGVGAVIFADEVRVPEPLVRGGGQERRQRSGTENVVAIAGFAAAIEEVIRDASAFVLHTRALQQRLEAGLKRIHPETIVFGEDADRLANTTCFAVPGTSSETALVALDLAGVAVSSGSACSSGKVSASHVLSAMGVDARTARGALRISTGLATTNEDIERFLAAWTAFIARHRERAVA